MRYLFVYESRAQDAKALLVELGLKDEVRLVVVKQREAAPSEAIVAELKALGQPPEAAVCGVVRKYQNAVASLCDVKHNPNEFRTADALLRAWLVPPAAPPALDTSIPSVAFANAIAAGARFHVAAKGLDQADRVDPLRHAFVRKAVKALTHLAAHPTDAGALRNWGTDHGVEYAPNGAVYFTCRILRAGTQVAEVTDRRWHLKSSGGWTTTEVAARIYFDVAQVGQERFVLVFYCGPHPKDGEHKVVVDVGAASP
jgi:hypothetical protein